MSTIELHIERLVLDGIALPPGGASVLKAAIGAELTRLLGEGGLSPAMAGGGSLAQVMAPAFTFQAGASPSELGRQLAGAVYEGIGSGTS